MVQLTHPNRCDHPQAATAFNIVEAAFNNLQQEQNKIIYKWIYLESKNWVEFNLSQKNESLNEQEKEKRIQLECRRLVIEIEEKKKLLFNNEEMEQKYQ